MSAEEVEVVEAPIITTPITAVDIQEVTMMEACPVGEEAATKEEATKVVTMVDFKIDPISELGEAIKRPPVETLRHLFARTSRAKGHASSEILAASLMEVMNLKRAVLTKEGPLRLLTIQLLVAFTQDLLSHPLSLSLQTLL